MNSGVLIAASKQNRNDRPDVLIADACQPETALKDVLDTDLLQSALLFNVHPMTADAFPVFDVVKVKPLLKDMSPHPSEVRQRAVNLVIVGFRQLV